MSQEAPTNLEQLLRRYSKERREQGGDFALHPATRRLLQGEVARELGAKNSASATAPAQSRFSLWRGPLLASAFILILGGGLFALVWNRDARNSMEMAKADGASERAVRPAAAAVDFAEDEKRATDALKKMEDRPAIAPVSGPRDELAMTRAPAEPPSAPAPTRAAPAAVTRSRAVAEKSMRESEVVASKTAPAPAAAPSITTAAAPAERFAMKGGTAGPAPESRSNTQLASMPAEQQQKGQQVEQPAEQPTVALADARQNTPEPLMKEGARQERVAANLGAIAQNVDGPRGQSGAAQGAFNNEAAQMQNSQLYNRVENNQRGLSTAAPGSAPAQQQRQGLTANSAQESQQVVTGGLQPNFYNNTLANNQLAGQKLAEMQQRRDGSAIDAVAPDSNGAALNYRFSANAPAPVQQEMVRRQVDTSATFAGGGARQLDRDEAKLKASEATPGADPAALLVLTRFNVSQSGETVRLTDADGSVYEGPIAEDTSTNATATFGSEVAAKRDVAAVFDAETVRRLPMRFKAVGTNRTLQQRVEIDARLPRLAGPVSFGLELAPDPLQRKANEKDVALQVVPPVSTVPSTAPFGGARLQRSAVRTNAPVVEGTLQVGASASRRFRAVGIESPAR